MMKSRLGNLRLYKFDVPSESDVGAVIVNVQGYLVCRKFQLTRYTGRRQGRGRAGLSKSFLDLVNDNFGPPSESNLPDQIFDYIASNFSFKDLDVVPPACPVLVFYINTTGNRAPVVPELTSIAFSRSILSTMRIRDSVLDIEDAIRVPIDPPVTEIIDCYQSPELCSLCGKGYPKEDEIVHKTKCNHIFHGKCISRHLFRNPRCPVCSTDLPPVDIRTLLFS